MSNVDLPIELARARVVSEREAAEFIGLSAGTLERLRKAGRGPRHVMMSDRRLGYRIGDLVDFSASLGGGQRAA